MKLILKWLLLAAALLGVAYLYGGVQIASFGTALLAALVIGLLNALLVLGMMLVYRANRVINMAQASIGALPAALGIGLVLFGGPSLAVAGWLGVVTAAVVGAAVAVLGLRLGDAPERHVGIGAQDAALRIDDDTGPLESYPSRVAAIGQVLLVIIPVRVGNRPCVRPEPER